MQISFHTLASTVYKVIVIGQKSDLEAHKLQSKIQT